MDGNCTWLAVIELRAENVNVWDSFCWPLTRLESIPEILIFRQLARSASDRHYESSYIETTLFDIVYGIRQEYDLLWVLRCDRRLLPRVEAAKAYKCGDVENTRSESMQSIISMSPIAIRHDIHDIEALREVPNEEGLEQLPIMTVGLTQKNLYRFTRFKAAPLFWLKRIDRSKLICLSDCAIFRNGNITVLYGEKRLLNISIMSAYTTWPESSESSWELTGQKLSLPSRPAFSEILFLMMIWRRIMVAEKFIRLYLKPLKGTDHNFTLSGWHYLVYLKKQSGQIEMTEEMRSYHLMTEISLWSY